MSVQVFPDIGKWHYPEEESTSGKIGKFNWVEGQKPELEFDSAFTPSHNSSNSFTDIEEVIVGDTNFHGPCTLLKMQRSSLGFAGYGLSNKYEGSFALIGKKISKADEKFIRTVKIQSFDTPRFLEDYDVYKPHSRKNLNIKLTSNIKEWISPECSIRIFSGYEYKRTTKKLNARLKCVIEIRYETLMSIHDVLTNWVKPLVRLLEILDFREFRIDNLFLWEYKTQKNTTDKRALKNALEKIEVIGDFITNREIEDLIDESDGYKFLYTGKPLNETMPLIDSLAKLSNHDLINVTPYILRSKKAKIPLANRLSQLFSQFESHHELRDPTPEKVIDSYKTDLKEVLEALKSEECKDTLDSDVLKFIKSNLNNFPRRKNYESKLIYFNKKNSINFQEIYNLLSVFSTNNISMDWSNIGKTLNELRNNLAHGASTHFGDLLAAEEFMIQYIRNLILIESELVDFTWFNKN